MPDGGGQRGGPDERTDEIAREAARLIETGKADSIDAAIRRAVERFNYHGVARPSHGLVRRHAQGMALQALGEEGYREQVRDVWRIAEDVMTILEPFDPILLGRGAKGQIDAGVTLHVRIHTRERVAHLAQWLVEHEYGEPAFATADTRFGRFDRLIVEEKGVPIVITRCLPEQRRLARTDLYTGQPIASLSLAELRARLAEGDRPGDADEPREQV